MHNIFIGNNILNKAGSHIKDHTRAAKLLVISNNTIYSLHGEKLKQALDGFEVHFLMIEDGEEYKNLDSLNSIWTKAIELKLERKDAIVAFGGGVVGDIAGFAAATYLRGVDFIQIPTTLLAQVDSSIGGKVAINHELGKNLIGNFYQPKAVITDVDLLGTLPDSELKVGMAEVLKYGFIEKSCGLDNNFIDKLSKRGGISGGVEEELVRYCVDLKLAVVNKDEKEAGLRAILNFGHTIGHAIEKCHNYKGITHGEAVAIGMRGVFIIAKNKGLISNEYYESSIKLLDFYNMDSKINKSITPEDLYQAMQVDKKVDSGKIRLILPTRKGEVGIFSDITKDEILNAVNCLY